METTKSNQKNMQNKTFTWSQTAGLSLITILLVTGVWGAFQMGPRLSPTFDRLAAAVVTFSQTFIPKDKSATVATSTENISTDPSEEVLATVASSTTPVQEEENATEQPIKNTQTDTEVKETKVKELTPGTLTEKTYSIGTEPTPTTFGKADLAPKILEIGIIDKVTNVFTATTTFNVSNRVAVKFQVENLGTADSGVWYFNSVLPTFPIHIFDSESQQSLAPGDRIEYTIGFDQVEPDVDGRFVINVDPRGSLGEATKNNNIATTTIRVSL